MQSVSVFCGAKSGVRSVYADAARELGMDIASRGLRLVYGGDRVGLMGAVADSALAVGGEVVGVIPRRHLDSAHPELSELRIVDTLHERKAMMAELSDAFIAMPGGYGTLEEFTEAVTWGQLGFHRKPTALFNVAHYFDLFLRFLDHAVAEGFIRPEYRLLVISGDVAGDLLDDLLVWEPGTGPAW